MSKLNLNKLTISLDYNIYSLQFWWKIYVKYYNTQLESNCLGNQLF